MQETEFSICRPAPGYWCVECCTKRADGNNPCSVLGKLPDESRGCLGHQTIDGFKKLHESQLCMDFFCWPELLNNPDDLKRVCEAILKKPPGEFKMSDYKH